MDREEITAELMASYRQELEALSDMELYSHWRVQKTAESMTPEQWEQVAKAVRMVQTAK